LHDGEEGNGAITGGHSLRERGKQLLKRSPSKGKGRKRLLGKKIGSTQWRGFSCWDGNVLAKEKKQMDPC